MNFDPGCDFCEIGTREEDAREVFRTKTIIAFFPTEPATLGHTLVVPRLHIPDIWALDRATAAALSDATLTVAHAIRAALSPDGLNIIQSNGKAATQSVPHLHVHLVPRSTNDAMGKIWPNETDWSDKQKDQTCKKIRSELRL